MEKFLIDISNFIYFHYVLDPKRSGKISQSYRSDNDRSDNVDVDESTKLINDLLRPFESVGKQPNLSVSICPISHHEKILNYLKETEMKDTNL